MLGIDGGALVQEVAILARDYSVRHHRSSVGIGLSCESTVDADNLLMCLDGLNGIAWKEDSQIYETTVKRVYGENPHL